MEALHGRREARATFVREARGRARARTCSCARTWARTSRPATAPARAAKSPPTTRCPRRRSTARGCSATFRSTKCSRCSISMSCSGCSGAGAALAPRTRRRCATSSPDARAAVGERASEKVARAARRVRIFSRCSRAATTLIVYDPAAYESDGGSMRELARFLFPRQDGRERLCLADYFRSVESGDVDVVAFQIVTVGDAATGGSRAAGEGRVHRSVLPARSGRGSRGSNGRVDAPPHPPRARRSRAARGSATRGAIAPVPIWMITRSVPAPPRRRGARHR